MDYQIKNPKILGDVIGLYSVAEAKAKRIGLADGGPLHEPAYKAALQDWVKQVASDAKSGSLTTSNHRGIRTPVDTLMAEFEASNGGCFMHDDESLNITTSCYVCLIDLNTWASSYGDHYTVTHDGWWIDERGIVGPGSEQVKMRVERTGDSLHVFIDESPSAPASSSSEVLGGKPVPRFAAQEAVILDAIKKAGYDPMALPVRAAGKAGVKAQVRKELVGVNALFQSNSKTFDKAWDRLRTKSEITDKV